MSGFATSSELRDMERRIVASLESLAERTVRALGSVAASLETTLSNQEMMMATIADLQAAESAESAAVQTVLANQASLANQLADAIGNEADPASIQALVDQVHANTAALTGSLPPASPPAAVSTTAGASTAATGAASGTVTETAPGTGTAPDPNASTSAATTSGTSS